VNELSNTRVCTSSSSGINVLDNKTELRKEMEKRKQRQQRRDDEQQRRLDRRSSFELRLEQQANKLQLVTDLFVEKQQQVCRSFLLSGRNVRWPRRVLPR